MKPIGKVEEGDGKRVMQGDERLIVFPFAPSLVFQGPAKKERGLLDFDLGSNGTSALWRLRFQVAEKRPGITP